LCTFLPLFGPEGAVEQYLVTVETIPNQSTTTGESGAEPVKAVSRKAGRRHTHGSGSSTTSSCSGRSVSRSKTSHSSNNGGSGADSGAGSASGATDRESANSALQTPGAVVPAGAVAATSNPVSNRRPHKLQRESSLTSEALNDAKHVDTDRRAANAAMQGAATQRWMEDVSATGHAQDVDAQRERSSGNKVQREEVGKSPRGVAAKSSRFVLFRYTDVYIGCIGFTCMPLVCVQT
jgi:hypothetical protein